MFTKNWVPALLTVIQPSVSDPNVTVSYKSTLDGRTLIWVTPQQTIPLPVTVLLYINYLVCQMGPEDMKQINLNGGCG